MNNKTKQGGLAGGRVVTASWHEKWIGKISNNSMP